MYITRSLFDKLSRIRSRLSGKVMYLSKHDVFNNSWNNSGGMMRGVERASARVIILIY